MCERAVALRATACESEALRVSCYEQDAIIRIINAHYGRLQSDICANSINTPNTECLFTGARNVVYDRSVNKSVSDTVYCTLCV